MEDSRKNIDEFFRRHMANHAETPPPAVWQGLEQRLDNHNTGGKTKRPFPLWWIWAVSSVVLISASVIIAGNLMNDKDMAAQVATEKKYDAVRTPSEATVNDNERNANDENIVNPGSVASNQLNEKRNEPVKSVSTKAGNTPDNITTTNKQKNSTQENEHTGIPEISDPKEIENSPQAPALVNRKPESKQEIMAAKQGSLPTSMPSIAKKKVIEVPKSLSGVNLIRMNVSGTSEIYVSRNTISPTPYDVPAYIPPVPAVSDDVIKPNAAPPAVKPMDTSERKMPIVDVGVPGLADTSILDNTEKEIVTEKSRSNMKLPVEAGIKAGYSKGFGSGWRADRVAISPYVEYKFPSNFSVAFQPTYLQGNVNTGTTPQGQSYHDITGNSFDSSRRLVRGEIDSSVLTPNPPDTVFYSYTYSQTYDSVFVSYLVKQTKLWEIELPLILKYSVTDNLSVFAGPSVNISSVVSTEEQVQRYTGLSKTYIEEADPQTFFVTTPNQPLPSGPPPKNIDDIFTHNTDPFSNYSPGQTSAADRNTFVRYGFMAGASATLNDRWLVDLMIHKSGVDKSVITDKNLQKLYTQPYIRITVGYKLLQSK